MSRGLQEHQTLRQGWAEGGGRPGGARPAEPPGEAAGLAGGTGPLPQDSVCWLAAAVGTESGQTTGARGWVWSSERHSPQHGPHCRRQGASRALLPLNGSIVPVASPLREAAVWTCSRALSRGRAAMQNPAQDSWRQSSHECVILTKVLRFQCCVSSRSPLPSRPRGTCVWGRWRVEVWLCGFFLFSVAEVLHPFVW